MHTGRFAGVRAFRLIVVEGKGKRMKFENLRRENRRSTQGYHKNIFLRKETIQFLWKKSRVNNETAHSAKTCSQYKNETA